MIYYCFECQVRVYRRNLYYRIEDGKKHFFANCKLCKSNSPSVISCYQLLRMKAAPNDVSWRTIDNHLTERIRFIAKKDIPTNLCQCCKHKFTCYTDGQRRT